jgi:UDP-N-acetylmuramoyl-L-alanyl-D-glutamate--2,6-diaminopimelate ligase
MNLERLVAALAPADVVRSAPTEVRGLAYDARAVEPGFLFFCVPGATADGHDFAADAVARGAAALVVERPLELPVPQVVVESSRAAMAVAADVFFGAPTAELPIAAVTGTNGKTTTSFLVYAILEAADLRPGLLGTIETRIGDTHEPAVRTTPEAIDLQRTFRAMLDAGNRSCALEASSHASELRRLDRVRFAALVFTNLTQDHLDFHGTMDAYFEAKRRLFLGGDGLPPAAINVDDPYGARIAGDLRAVGHEQLVTFGLGPDAELRPDALELGAAGTRMRVGELELTTRLHGRFNALNVLGAVGAARLLGIGDDAIAAGVATLPGVPGRFEAVDEGQPFPVVVDYAHTPDSLENVLRAARELARDGRVVLVFGCGGDRDRGKRPLMGAIAAELADLAIATTDNPRTERPEDILAEVVAGAPAGALEVEIDRRSAIERAIESAREGDVVVIAGKGHEQGQEVAGVKHPFDDRKVARDALRKALMQS